MQAFFAIFNHFPRWGWTSLPKKYLDNEYPTADSAALINPSNGGNDAPVSNNTAPDLDGEGTMGIMDELPQHQVSL